MVATLHGTGPQVSVKFRKYIDFDMVPMLDFSGPQVSLEW